MTPWQWYLLAFMLGFGLGPLLARTVLIWRATGRNPLLLQSPETAYGFVQVTLSGVMLGFALLATAYLFWPAAYAWIPAFEGLRADPFRWSGVVLSALGLVVAWLAQGQMGRSWRFGPDRDAPPPLVTEGIFGFCRNPIYLSMMLAGTGLFLLLADAFSAVLLAVGLFSLNVLVRLEEAFLREAHGAAYEAYLSRVGRFGPHVR